MQPMTEAVSQPAGRAVRARDSACFAIVWLQKADVAMEQQVLQVVNMVDYDPLRVRASRLLEVMSGFGVRARLVGC
ncbi:MAG TPA: hypothetical protein ENK62_02675 [Chromatiales bacterium]|nr:hypothetical protein [Chromatiales bacterium]